ncbi:phage portal protein [Blautia marasmi]|uniref:phage portal protein n=1 Tax=Blautia marasmi TaxID=1917868 RepID=UPI00266D6FA9|nr:phage portal protein [Blautia marasmi]
MKVGLIKKMSEGMKRGIRGWLNIQDANPAMIMINETLDYEANAIKNRIWYRGDSNELQQLYCQINTGVDRYKFWASKSSPGQEMRKIHTGLPALIVDTLAGISLTDLKIRIEKSSADLELWEAIEADNKFRKKLEKAVKETLYIGDGAFKISFDTALSQYPIIEFYPGDRIELVTERGRIREIVFKTVYQQENVQYVLYEYYGYGYITYELYKDNEVVDLHAIPQTANLVNVAFGTEKPGEHYMMAVPIQFYESGKWDERGQSVFDKKIDSFDAFDETWSQWMDALRKGRAKVYMPEDLIPKDPNGGALLKSNAFDDSFIKISGGFSENEGGVIDIVQPNIPHDSYLASYVTALDLCLQGLISPSTLGIDMKKLDNAEAQREKEKATLYTRDTIINALQVDIPLLVETAIKAYNEFYNKPVTSVEATADFGDYANPSFESQIETISKARAGQIMSVDAAVDELYGDDKDEDWKQKEVKRIKAELGIAEEVEPGVNQELDGFRIGGMEDESKSGTENIPDDPEGVPGTAGDSQ